MYKTQLHEYDVVIMGAGFAGNCQARHLLLNIPNIKVALIDPRSEERTEKDLKLGESMVEVAALFVCKELGLHDYLIENHPPKSGLNFHWPKDVAKTESLEDYYHVWSNRQVAIPSFHFNRAKLEQDLLKMNKDMGVVFYNGRVVDVDLTPGDALKTVKIKLDTQEIDLKAKHVIDAAGRKFIIGRKKNNVLFGPENLHGLNNGTAWVWVKNVDRTIFHDGYDPNGASSSHYYATNHWLGQGHWLWMIPTDKEPMGLSVGMMHHHDVIPAEKINTSEKFYEFLKANHNVLYQLIKSGEQIEFNYWSRPAHTSKTMFSPDNWYVIGDAAYIFDAFYSYGTTTIAFAVECVTEIIRAKLAGEPDVENKRTVYNKFNLEYARLVNCLYRHHNKQLGHASVMSWRIYFEYMWWFGVNVPMFIGKWHLDPTFVSKYVEIARKNTDGIFADVYKQFNQLVDRGANIGLMDCYRADQLIGKYHTLKHFDDFLENSKFEPKHCNVFAGMKHDYFYIALWYVLFQWKGFGLAGILNPRHIYYFFHMLSLSAQAAVGELIYRYKTKKVPANSQVEKMRQEFKSYRYQPKLRPWLHNLSDLTPAKQDQSSLEEEKTPELSISG
ncbi:tryptophan 7-halogenase [Aetokthonos hydrillicola Thurmond2011]|jgi:flavin-dependent dehydrogenase|uniref:Tryptophan 7-halogenase n=1 Tax=Aetokthonos hydrillicola Thurmond2011 TaxID=2712845 RepID=A0AAP5ID26_9CYAN|nr:tryptophan 7-halogenase [Aetokthonos hydrillicola]MBW4585732.1 tryptophan 7-halogenase [Aetokthonos hydrillicola CCALA 1050]MDR9899236.1 tryptophan 7-halogenase [Aetokthonos hydrillicola Thurmond2011]